ncbi:MULTISPECIES: hypothetical protein [unclassified Aeromonas]|uniref:hypothetical protein n=1 Tax=unclassified Aeromonas TaxID=257493 RepID=UPI003529949C
MATLYQTIKNTAGLLAYWPLWNDGVDHSGNGKHLSIVGGFNQGKILSNDMMPTFQSANPGVNAVNTSIHGRVLMASLPGMVSMELYFAGPSEYSETLFDICPFCFNATIGGSLGRLFVYSNHTIPGLLRLHCENGQGSFISADMPFPLSELLRDGMHLVIQYEQGTNETVVYIDGVKTQLFLPGNLLIPVANSYLVLGMRYHTQNTSGVSCVADVATYNRPLTKSEIDARASFKISPPMFMPVSMTAVAANQEPRSQFQPQDVAWRGRPPLFAGPMLAAAVTADPLCKGQDLAWVRDGNQNALQGYIESTVTIDGEGVRRRVLCFDQAGNLIGETYSRAGDGKYRFDLLWLNRRYMLVAQDDPAFGPADYNAVAADYQLPTPYAPGEGVGLV